MSLIDEILSKENLNKAYKQVVSNKGSAGVDGVNVEKRKDHFKINGGQVRKSILARTYKPSPVKRVYIPKITVRKDH
jgi:retron-type reverse transcriptase